MGKKRHKKSFYDVDEEELESYHRHRRHRHSNEKQNEIKEFVSSIPSFSNSKTDYDEGALQSPPVKRQRLLSSNSQSSSGILSKIIDDPEFLANAGPKAKEFAETARQLLSKPDLDPTTQQIICAMAQAAVNVGKRLSSSSSTFTEQCVDENSVANSINYLSSTSLSPSSLSNASSSSSSTTPQQQIQLILSRDENKLLNEPETDDDILMKQMIERAMKLTRQGDTHHAQHLLGIIHKRISSKRNKAALNNEKPKTSLSSSSNDDFYSLSSVLSDDSQGSYNKQISPSESEHSSDYQTTSNFSYPAPPPPPLPPPPPPPLSDANSMSIPPIEQVQELLSNPLEVQDILKKMFGANEYSKVTSPEEYRQIQSHVTSPTSFYSQNSIPYNNLQSYPMASRLNTSNQALLTPVIPTASTSSRPMTPNAQPYNSSLAFMQGNRRNLPPLQSSDRCFSSSNTKSTKQPTNRSLSYSSTSNTGINPTNCNSTAPPLMKVNPTFSSAPLDSMSLRASHPFWCATCALGFSHQTMYQDHLRTHIPCIVPGCSYAASEHLIRIHHQNIHEHNLRNQIRPLTHPQQSLETPWPLMRM